MAEEKEYEVTLVRKVTVKAKLKGGSKAEVWRYLDAYGYHDFALNNGDIMVDVTVLSGIEEIK